MPVLQSLTIENFKGIGRKVFFEFKPITLFFGQNSAGKSTVLHAINYLYDLLNYHNVNADNTLLGHDALDLGGFKQFVHMHELDRAVSLEIRLDLREIELIETDAVKNFQDSYLSNAFQSGDDENGYQPLDISSITSRIDSAKIRLQINWSESLKSPYVKQLNVDLNGEAFIQLSASSDCKRREITKINIGHSLFVEPFGEEGLYTLTELIIDEPILDRLGNAIIGIDNCSDALPDYKKPLILTDIWIGEIWQESARKNEFKGIVSALLLGPLEVAAKELAEMRYLGPIRNVPQRNHSPKPTENKNWSNGLAAWDLLFKENLTLLKEVNGWLNDTNRLNTGYKVKIAEYRQFQVGSRLESLLNVNDINENKAEIEQLMTDMPVEKQFVLIDTRRAVDVYPGDVGIGISQILPVVVGALSRKVSILSIEQPELHIHPALQVALGDLLIFAAKQKNKSFIIETHSEHIMLRLLRRIRETANDELEDPGYSFNPADLNVVYVDCIDGETRLIPLRVDEEGEFIDRWPKGFFGERAEELF